MQESSSFKKVESPSALGICSRYISYCCTNHPSVDDGAAAKDSEASETDKTAAELIRRRRW
ncbi:hypothetical protein KHA80_15895 [Anaerobacillus sp. HL2]|nr:hypothetical protein KHA80_15895 [Anaerobacillus sp. HL2]